MNLRPRSWLAALSLAGVLLAGCGSSTSTTTQSTPSTPGAVVTGTATTPGGTTVTGTATTPGAVSVPANVPGIGAAAVSACKSAIHAQTTLPEGTKAKLEGVCDKAASGQTSAVRQVAKEVCEEAVNHSPIPAGAAREQALAACKAK